MSRLETVTTSAPGKLMFFGDHAVVHDRPCIVTAIDQRIQVTVQTQTAPEFHLSAPDVGLREYVKPFADLAQNDVPKAVAFLEHCLQIFLEKHPQERGISVTTKSEFSSNFGFGSSSAVTVAFAKALSELYEVEFDNKQLFDLCYQAVLAVQGVGSGFDIASAIWGGTIYYVKPAKVVRELDAADMSLVVGYTGIKADTPTLVRMVNEKLKNDPQKIEAIFNQMATITELAKTAIQAHEWKTVGELMIQNQVLLEELGVSSVELRQLTSAAEQGGAYGAKLSGAGGGDCMIAVTDEKSKATTAQAIDQAGGEVMSVKMHAQGVRLESN